MELINFQQLEKRYQGDRVFQQDIIETFVRRIPIYVSYVKFGLIQKDIENILCYSIQLRGIAQRCCVGKLTELCLCLESQVEAEDFNSAEMTLQDIQKILRLIEEAYPVNLSYLL